MSEEEKDDQGGWTPPAADAAAGSDWTPPTTDAATPVAAPPRIPLSMTPGTAAADPNRPATLPAIKGGPGENVGKALADWKSWLPAGAATAAELAGPPGWAGLGVTALAAGAGSLLKSGLEKDALPTDPQSLQTAGWDALTQGAVPNVIGRATASVLGRLFNPEQMYLKALRPTGLTEEADKAVRAGLEGNVQLGWNMPAARAGNKARQQAFDSEVEKLINTTPGNLSPQQYATSVQNGLDQLRGKWMMDPIEGPDFLDQIDEAEKSFLISHGKAQPIQRVVTNKATGQSSVVTIPPQEQTLNELRSSVQPMSLPRAQAIKQQAYTTTRANQKTVQTAWSSQYQSGLGVETRNEIASALREDLENYPGLQGLKDLNRQSGDSQALDKALEKFARRLPSMGSYATTAAGGLGGFLLGHDLGSTAAGASLGLIKHALEDPAVRSRLAIALYGIRPALQTPVAGALGSAAVRAPIAATKIAIDADRAKQFPGQAKGGPAKSDSYLDRLERRAVNRKAEIARLQGGGPSGRA